MFYSKSYLLKKQDLFFMLLILFGMISICMESNPTKSSDSTAGFVASTFISDDSHSMTTKIWENKDFFVPGIAVILSGETKNYLGITPGCSYVEYVIEIVNTSTNGESFNDITIDMGPDVTIESFKGGDDNLNNQLDDNEIWTYVATKSITDLDIQASEILKMAHIEATVVGLGTVVTDDSHPTDINLDGDTQTKLSCVTGISLVKTGISKNPLGEDGGCASINYTFEVSHTGSPTEMFGTVVITDPMLAAENIQINGPIDGDFGTPDILEPGETWIYEANYPIKGDDLINGFVDNQAYVEAKTFIVPGNIASDLSDHTSVDQDRPTRIDILQCQPIISLIQTGVAKDGFGQDGGCDFIEYNFTVTNESDPNNGQGQIFKDILLDDSYLPLPDILTGPNGDVGLDGLLGPGEVWTYQAIYQVTSQDILNGEVVTQSQVSASLVEGPQITINDLSDYEDITLDRETVVSLSHCPRIAVIKEGTVSPDCATIDYLFTVTNESKESLILENVVLSDPKLPVIDGPTGDDGNNLLELGEIWEYTATYNITPEDINAGHVENQAMATADVFTFPNLMADDLSDDDSVLENQITSTDLTGCQLPSIELIKEGQISDQNMDGCFDAIKYTFTVTNIGNVDLHTIDLQDDQIDEPAPILLPGEDENNDGILSIGEDWVFEGTHAVIQADIDNGFVINNADVSALSVGNDTPTADQAQVQTDLPADLCAPLPAIELLKVGNLNIDNDNNGCLDGITYTFTVTNIGNVDLHTINLQDDQIDELAPVLLPGEDENNDGILSIGENWIFEGTHALIQADIDNGFVINNADVSALSVGNDAPTADQAQVQTNLPADLCAPTTGILLNKTGNPNIDADQDGCIDGIRYTFTVTNIGNVELQNIVLNDPMLGGDILGPIADDLNDGILSVDEVWEYQADYTLTDADKNNGSVENQATVSATSIGDNMPVSDIQNAQTILPADLCNPLPGIALIKTGTLIDLNMDGCNESILYSFRVLNIGELALESIVVVDPMLGGIISGPLSDTDENNDGILSQGESWNYEVLYAITQQDIDMGSVTNQATATANVVGDNQEVSDFSDDNSPSEDDPTNTVVPNDVCTMGGATIGLIKTGVLTDTDGDECPESIKYIFTVTNTGEFDLEEIQLTDEQLLGGQINGPVSGKDINDDGLLSIGESWEYEAFHSISEQDVLNGSVSNQATVSASPVGIVSTIFDLSDNDSLDEDETTLTLVPDYMCLPENEENPDFEIFSGLTPNGDGMNDYFRISGIDSYPDNILKIFNRWGALVYEAEGYGIGNNLFFGVSEGQATILKEKTLPSGTYFYVLTFPTNNPGQASYSGYLYINRD